MSLRARSTFKSPGNSVLQAHTSLTLQSAPTASQATARMWFSVAPFAPGIFTVNASGTGQDTVLIGNTAQLAASTAAFQARIRAPRSTRRVPQHLLHGSGPRH